MKVLMYDNRKIDPILWDASTEELEQKAYLALFNMLSSDWMCYSDLTDGLVKDLTNREQSMLKLFYAASAGDGKAAKELSISRRDYEYEYAAVYTVKQP